VTKPCFYTDHNKHPLNHAAGTDKAKDTNDQGDDSEHYHERRVTLHYAGDVHSNGVQVFLAGVRQNGGKDTSHCVLVYLGCDTERQHQQPRQLKTHNISQLRIERHLPYVESHSVNWHLTRVNVPYLNFSQTGRYSIYLPQRDGRLS